MLFGPAGSFPVKLVVVFAILLALARPAPGAEYIVRAGDTLYQVAQRELGDGRRWTEIAEANGLVEPWTIKVGDRLVLPDSGTPRPIPSRPENRPASAAASADRPASRPETPIPPAPTTARGQSVASSTATAAPRDLPAVTSATTSAPSSPLAAYRRDDVLDGLPETPTTEPWTLEEARRRALTENLGLRTQTLADRSAAASVASARAAFDPTLSASVNQSWSRTRTIGNPAARSDAEVQRGEVAVAQSLTTGTRYAITAEHARSQTNTATTTGSPAHVADISLSVTQPLLEGFGAAARADLDARSAEAEATRRTTDRRRTTTVAEVDAAYWILAEAEESERVARNSLERARTIHGRNLALLKEGMIAEIEVLTAENGVAARKEALIAAMLSRIQSAENLLFLVEGEAAARVVALPRIATAVPAPSLPPDAAMLEAGALRARPDLAAAEADLRAAGIRLDAARNALLPDLDLTAAAGTGGRAGRFGAAWDGLSSNDEPSWSIGARLTFPIGNRADRASAEASAATRERKRLAQATLINEVRQGVRDAHRTVVLGIARLEAAGESRRLAEARLAAEEKRLEFGLSDTLRLLDVEESASSAALAETRARFAVARAWASLKSAAPQLNETGQ